MTEKQHDTSKTNGNLASDEVVINEEEVKSIHAETVHLQQSAAQSITGQKVNITQSGAQNIKGHKINLTQGGAGVIAGEEITLNESGAGAVVANSVKINNKSMAGVIIAKDIKAESQNTFFLVAGKIKGDVKTLLDVRSAFIFGAVLGVVLGLFILLRGTFDK